MGSERHNTTICGPTVKHKIKIDLVVGANEVFKLEKSTGSDVLNYFSLLKEVS